MMRYCLITIFFLSIIAGANAQDVDIDNVKKRLEASQNDTLQMMYLDTLAFAYSETNPDSSFHYSERAGIISRKLDFKLNEAFALNSMGYAMLNMGNYPKALQIFLEGLKLADDPANEKRLPPEKYRIVLLPGKTLVEPRLYRLQCLTWLHFNMGILYENTGNTEKQLQHYRYTLRLAEGIGDQGAVGVTSMNLGRVYLLMNKLDSALYFEQKAYDISKRTIKYEYSGSVLLNLGRVYLAMGNEEQAKEYVHKAIARSRELRYFRGVIAGNLLLSDISFQNGKTDSAFYFAQNSLRLALQLNSPDLLLRCYNTLSALYRSRNNSDSAVKYQGLIIRIKDSLFNSKQAQQFQNIDFNEVQRQQELESARKDYRDRLQKYLLIGGLAIFLFVLIILWRNNSIKQKAYGQLKKQKEETDAQKIKAEKALEELKTTQAQLIQSEKMASLGELTAGIAHEIQNPLNFVNNFSDVNKELLSEMNSEIEKGNYDEVRVIARDIIDNEQKVNHHGKRADAIVKGMLQHSRSSSGQKELTDINALCDEYFRLSYHGLRAKDKSFNATTQTDFDNSIGKISVVPQEIGRVILNLINNAFYAVNEKENKVGESYEPVVSIGTRRVNGNIEISVKDNGNGIPSKVIDKIFQPFFTTKPAGQGTGLGLSMSYDIIKAHNGELRVETKEGEGSEFIIHLPVQ